MSAQPVGVFGVGVSPPPESSDPTSHARRSLAELLLVVAASVNMKRSACVIWPIFSASDIRDNRSLTRWEIGRLGLRYGRPCASMTTVGGLEEASVAVSDEDRAMLIVLASEGALAASVWTSKLRLVPETLPAGKVTLPEA